MNFPKITLLFLPLFFLQTHAIIFNIQNNCPYTVWAAAVPGGGRRLDRGQTWTHNSKMNFPKITLLFLPLFFLQTHAIIFNIQNNCPYTVWAAAVPGGGRRLDRGQTWTISFPNGPKLAKIWARTNCTFNASGRGSCLTGDCNGLLQCQAYGTSPVTLAEYGLNSFAHKDYYDISLFEGFNVPMEFTPTTNGCSRPIRCTADITGQCPNELKAPGGCNNPCTVYKTTEYCCHSGKCRPTNLSRFFKSRCRDTFTYPEDDPTSTFTCPAGTSYRVVFCP